MKICFPNYRYQYSPISFSAMKKSQFDGYDLAAINKFKAPIEKFNSKDDFNKWCLAEINKMKLFIPKGRDEETFEQRVEIIEEWQRYLLGEKDKYSLSLSLIIMKGILKNLREDNDTIPPALNTKALAKTKDELDITLKNDPKAQIKFEKIYLKNLQKQYFGNETISDNSNYTGWIIIPSKINNPDEFSDNIEKLKTLSYKSWCTKSYNAQPYLSRGDMHIYFEHGQPKLAIRFDDDYLREIQGEKNNSKIPLEYLDMVLEYIKDYKISVDAKHEIECAKSAVELIEKYRSKIGGREFRDLTPKELFETFGIKADVGEDGLLILSEYCQPDREFTYADLGIDESELFKNVGKITGNIRFIHSDLTRTYNLKTVEGNIYLCDSRIEKLDNIEEIKGNADFAYSNIRSLGCLKTIEGNASFNGTKNVDLGELETIYGHADFNDSGISDLAKLRYIGKDTRFRGSKIKALKNLEYIGGNADFRYSRIEDLGALKEIGGNADFGYSEVSNLGGLEKIQGEAHFNFSKVKEAPKLTYIGAKAYADFCELKNNDKFKKIYYND